VVPVRTLARRQRRHQVESTAGTDCMDPFLDVLRSLTTGCGDDASDDEAVKGDSTVGLLERNALPQP